MLEPRSQKTFYDDMIKIFRKKAGGISVAKTLLNQNVFFTTTIEIAVFIVFLATDNPQRTTNVSAAAKRLR
jgi:hypothetical protein